MSATLIRIIVKVACVVPVVAVNNRLHQKEWVLGVNYKSLLKAYPFSEQDKSVETAVFVAGEGAGSAIKQ